MGVKRAGSTDSGLSCETETITEEEAELYDRQIRLWGLESQKRLRDSRILVIGMGGLGAEVCKNIALAGIRSITLLDTKLVESKDFSSQFLLDASTALGKNRAESSEAGICQLNPNVEVKTVTEDVSMKEEMYFSQFDVICATDCPTDVLLTLNNICRSNSVKFFCGDVFGFCGYCFADLGNHDYLEEVLKSVPKEEVDDEVAPPSKKGKKNMTKEVELVKKSLKFVSLGKALSLKYGKSGTGLRRATSAVFFVVHIILKFREKHGRLPSSENFSDEIEELRKIRDEVLAGIGFNTDKVTDELLSGVFGEISPVCAIVGGVLAQEVIKAVSEKDTPIQNFYLFDGNTCCGAVENVGR